jgi:aryl-alcohol dehydrogenase-like predicted oxidoreductase
VTKVYSNGLSEIILGKAIKLHKLPRDEIVIMTKVWVLHVYRSLFADWSPVRLREP